MIRGLVLILISTLAAMATPRHAHRMFQHMELDIRDKIVLDLGMNNIPDMAHANVSSEEFDKMYKVYLQSVHQTNAMKDLRSHFNAHFHDQTVKRRVIKSKGHHQRRKKRSSSSDYESINFNLSPLHKSNSSSVLVKSSLLTLRIGPHNLSEAKIHVAQRMSTGELIFLDTLDTTDITGEEESDEEFIIQLDITHAVQAWLEDPSSNLGVKVIFSGVTEPPPMSSEPELSTETRFLKRSVRTKRSTSDESIIVGPSDCPASPPTTPPNNWSRNNIKKRNTEKCCRKRMPVELHDIQGFGFIYQPQQFDAAFCAGRCPPRYNPLNDHSLLQSLMHMRARAAAREDIREGRYWARPEVKSPCCSPASFENLDILHLDEMDPTKLRVTNWKDVIVSECACA